MPTRRKFIKHFQALGLPKNATEQDVKDARNRLALSYHPDKASQDEQAEAHEYMIEVNEACEILLKDCFPQRASLKRRLSSNDAVDGLQLYQPSSATFGEAEEPARKKHRKHSRFAQEQPSPHPAGSTQSPPRIPDIRIDIEQIRIDFSEMTKSRLMKQPELTSLIESEIGLLEKGSKIGYIIFATKQKVYRLLNERRWPSPDLDQEAERRCQSDLTKEWAQKGKEACQDELVRCHGYDHIRVGKWKLWQMVNEVVKVKRNPFSAVLSSTPSTSLSSNQCKPPSNSDPSTHSYTSNTPATSDNANGHKAVPATHTSSNSSYSSPKSQHPHATSKPYRPTTHPELSSDSKHAFSAPTNPTTAFLHEQKILHLSHATNLKPNWAGKFLEPNDHDYNRACDNLTQLESDNQVPESVYLPRHRLVQQFSYETGLKLEWARGCLAGYEYDYEQAKQCFERETARGAIGAACYIPVDRQIERREDAGKD